MIQHTTIRSLQRTPMVMPIQHTALYNDSEAIDSAPISNVAEHEEPGNQDTLPVHEQEQCEVINPERKSRKRRGDVDPALWETNKRKRGKVAPGR